MDQKDHISLNSTAAKNLVLNLRRSIAKQALICTTLIGGIGLTPCSATETSLGTSPVKSFTIKQQTVPEWSEYHGVVGSRNSVDMVALVTGRIKSVHVVVGQGVRKGDVLVELESDELQAKLRAAESGLAAAEAGLVEASSEHDRFKQLVLKGMISGQQMDKSIAKWKGAQAAVAMAKAQVQEARTLLSYTVLKSPMAGVVSTKMVNPGDFVMPGLPANLGYPAGRVLMTVYDPKALWFESRIPERFSQQILVGTKAGVTIPSANLSLEGRFVEVLPAVDENTRTFIARVNLPSQPALKLGTFGRARFVSGQRGVIQIPESALIERGQLDSVFVHSGGRAHLRIVRCGKRSAGNVEIFSGLTTGETVILNPRESMHDGDSLVIGS